MFESAIGNCLMGTQQNGVATVEQMEWLTAEGNGRRVDLHKVKIAR